MPSVKRRKRGKFTHGAISPISVCGLERKAQKSGDDLRKAGDGYALGIPDYSVLAAHPILGKSWEGFVIENLAVAAPPDTRLFFYRTAAGAEIDLVLELPRGQLWAVEIKYGLSASLGAAFITPELISKWRAPLSFPPVKIATRLAKELRQLGYRSLQICSLLSKEDFQCAQDPSRQQFVCLFGKVLQSQTADDT